MKSTINGFNQKVLIDFGLDTKDALLLRYFVDFKDTESMKMIIIDEHPYYWVNYDSLKKDIPIIDIKSNAALRRRLKKLEECKVLKHYHLLEKGSYSYYSLGENYHKLLENIYEFEKLESSRGATQKFEGCNLKVRGVQLESLRGATQKFEQKDATQKFEGVQLKSSNKDNNIYINNIYSANKELIEEIWAMYPNKKGKTKSLEYISKILKKISADELKRCVIRYSKEVKGKDKQYILNGSTFFHTRYADYLDSEYESINTEKNYRTTKPSKPKYIPVLMEDM